MTYRYSRPDVDFEKVLDSEVYVDMDWDVEVDVKKDTNININLNVDPKLEGNVAEFIGSVEAVTDGWGYDDTYTQLDLAVLTIDNTLSSIDVYAISAVE